MPPFSGLENLWVEGLVIVPALVLAGIAVLIFIVLKVVSRFSSNKEVSRSTLTSKLVIGIGAIIFALFLSKVLGASFW